MTRAKQYLLRPHFFWRGFLSLSSPHLFSGTALAVIVFARHHVPVRTQMYHGPTLSAMCRFKRRGILKLFKVVFIRPIPDIHLCLKIAATLCTFLPTPCVSFIIVRTAQRITVVIARTRVVRVRKKNIVRLIITNPIAATECACQSLLGRTTQATAARFRAGVRLVFSATLCLRGG